MLGEDTGRNYETTTLGSLSSYGDPVYGAGFYWNGTATSSPIYNETAIKMDLEHYVNVVVDVQAGKPTVLDTIK